MPKMQVLGVGTSGFVSQQSDSETTVIKQIFPSFDAELKVEVQVYELLGDHPRIAKFHGPVDQGFILQYYSHGSIFKFRLHHLEVPLLKWSEQIAEGLAYLHSKKVIHCDFRPDNALVTDTNDVVLIDFGSAMLDGVKPSKIVASHRYRPASFGERGYSITVKDDLFAFGSVMYYLATRREPYGDKTAEEVVDLYAKGKFPDVATLPVGEVIMNCWLGEYSSASNALEDIRKCIYSPICELGSDSDAFTNNLVSK
ncbi:hypothetical protein FQN54_007204 [Arachnomyces sp. PD_36]|nr:hypothetical protein FQN54_007204 [Arachnomyces sp. PD_36]